MSVSKIVQISPIVFGQISCKLGLFLVQISADNIGKNDRLSVSADITFSCIGRSLQISNYHFFQIFHFQVGKCRSRLQRFYYDTDHGVCRSFTYSGCQGNANNFVTENECIDTCVLDANKEMASEPKASNLGDPCLMKKEKGICRAMKPMYYFDANLKVCKLFFYGGCGGNKNR